MVLTKDEVKKIQTGGIDWFGAPLKVDGDYGPRTKWWHGITTLNQKRQDVLRLALGYHAANVKEATGNNDGPFVDMLLKPAGLKNMAWCLALVSHCYVKCNVPWPKYHTSAYQVIEWAKANQKIVTDPIPGDLECFTYDRHPGDTQIKGHGRLILAYDPVTKITAGVDGNVQNGCRVGYRHNRANRVFIRPNGLPTANGQLTMPANLVDLDQLGDR